jgi:hypothetical protein
MCKFFVFNKVHQLVMRQLSLKTKFKKAPFLLKMRRWKILLEMKVKSNHSPIKLCISNYLVQNTNREAMDKRNKIKHGEYSDLRN